MVGQVRSLTAAAIVALACSLLELDPKHLSRELVRAIPPDSPLEVAVNRGEVEVEEDAEQLRLGRRPREDLGVAAESSITASFPDSAVGSRGLGDAKLRLADQ